MPKALKRNRNVAVSFALIVGALALHWCGASELALIAVSFGMMRVAGLADDQREFIHGGGHD